MSRPDSIRAIGLKNYLNNTAYKHNGLKYQDFRKRLELGVTIEKIRIAFGVSRPTVEKWISYMGLDRER